MHTFLIILVGYLILGFSYFISTRRKIRFFRFFPVLWFAICLVHLMMGLNAGYTLADELQIHALVFGIPVLTWLGISEYLKRRQGSLL
jgi:hypothetical protein